MREIVINVGTYGLRIGSGRVCPISRGGRAKVPDDEAVRLVSLGVASFADASVEALNSPPAPPSGGNEPEGRHQDASGEESLTEAATGGEENDADSAEVKRLERMQKSDLEQMAQDMGVDISEARNNHERAVLIAAAGEPEDGDAPLDIEDEDIVR